MTRPTNAPFAAGQPPAPYHHIRVHPLTPAIGAEIEGADLTAPLSEAVFAEVERAFAENLVLFFRDQPMTPDQHLAFGQRFGDLDIHPAAPSAPGHPELMIVAADETSSRANGEAWHTDVSCNPEPPMGSVLHIRTCPPVGGDTLFASMYAAWDSLSDGMKDRLSGLTAVHDGEHVYRGLYADLGVADRPLYPVSVHPIARVHPVTGRTALFVNSGFTTRIPGLAPDESDALLKYLFQHLQHPAFQCRFRWTPDAVAFWDNRCAQHHAVWDYWPARRFGHRVTIKGDRPV